MKGYILLHKKLLDWEWYTDANTARLFLHCLLKANYINKKWRGKLIKRGQFVTSLDNLKTELQLSMQQVRTSLDKLVLTGNIAKTATNSFTQITVLNFDYYQKSINFLNKPNDNLKTNQQLPGNNQITTTKEEKENERSNKEKKEERSAHNFLKQDKTFWNEFIETYKSKIDNFELMLKKFDLIMQADSFGLDKLKLQARLESYALSWIQNQGTSKNNRHTPHR